MTTFTLFDIKNLFESFKNATIGHDCLAEFLNSYRFEHIYETEDESIVFDVGGQNEIEIEFFNFNHPLKRTFSIVYKENGQYKIIYSSDF